MSFRQDSSYSYKTIRPEIKAVLEQRGQLNNVVQMAMPFVRATTTLQHPEYLGDGNFGFTLGLHAINEDVKWEDIYASQGDGAGLRYPLVGYTYQPNGTSKRIYANPPLKLAEELAFINQFYNEADTLVNTITSPKIPPPGITSLTVGTNKNAMSMFGQIQISVPSLAQLEVLHRTFLIPGVGVILEWGQQFAQEKRSADLGEDLISSINTQYMFPWYNRDNLTKMLKRLAVREVGIREIMDCYTVPLEGKYSWMFGRIGNFGVKANSDGSYDVTVKIIGQGEDSTAYQTKVTAVAPADNSGTVCAQNENSVYSYFTSTVAGGLNFKTLLDSVRNDTQFPSLPELSDQWKGHVIFIEKGNKNEGNVLDPNKPNISTSNFGDMDDAYFLSWRFFVNVVLNHPKHGIMAIFDRAFEGTPDKQNLMKKISLLRPYIDGRGTENEKVLINIPGDLYINDPAELFVGNNPFLRSVDPGVLIIVNEDAAKLAELDPIYKSSGGASFVEENIFTKRFLAKGNFHTSADKADTGENQTGVRDRGFLSTGVWVNHKAVVAAMAGSNTILQGITNLLNAMSGATRNYWKLSLDHSYPPVSSQCSETPPSQTTDANHNYTVIDLNYFENSKYAVNNFLQGPNSVHTFNKFVRNKDGVLVGSDVIDCVVDMSLPRALYTSIATMGLFTNKDLNDIGNVGKSDEQLRLEQLENQNRSPEQQQLESRKCSNALVSDANESLRRMFSFVSISPTNGKSPDLTVIDTTINDNTAFTCGQPNTQLTAEAAGGGYQSGPGAPTQPASTFLQNKAALEEILNSPTCQQCKQQAQTNYLRATSTSAPTDGAARQLQDAGFENGKIPRDKLKEVAPGFFLYGTAADSFVAMREAAARDGVTLALESAYRTFEQQKNLRDRWDSGDRSGLAAQPAVAGRSNHGWALAVDIKVSGRPEVLSWLQSNASIYGFTTIAGDPPHWEFKGTLTQPIEKLPGATNPFDQATKQPTSGSLPNPTFASFSTDCARCSRAQQDLNQLSSANTIDETLRANATLREFPSLFVSFRYVEIFPERMQRKIRCDSDGIKSNAFGVAPTAMSIKADLTLPGIAGIRVGELFWVDRVPSFYKAFGAFQVMSVEHNVSRDGWLTKIEARFNYLGEEWKRRMIELYGKSKTANAISDAVTAPTTNQSSVDLFKPITNQTVGTIPKSTIPRLSPIPNAQNLQLRLPTLPTIGTILG